MVQQGNRTENSALISYGAEGYRWPDNGAQIAFNTLVNDRSQGGVFIAIRPGPVEAAIANNILVGRGKFDVKAPATITNNAEARVADFADPSSFDYRLRTGSRLVGTAGPASAFGKEDRPSSQYQHAANSVALTGMTERTPLSPGAFQRLAQ